MRNNDAEHTSDVLNEDEIVHVPEGVVELAESLEHHGETFIADVSDWDAPVGDEAASAGPGQAPERAAA